MPLRYLSPTVSHYQACVAEHADYGMTLQHAPTMPMMVVQLLGTGDDGGTNALVQEMMAVQMHVTELMCGV